MAASLAGLPLMYATQTLLFSAGIIASTTKLFEAMKKCVYAAKLGHDTNILLSAAPVKHWLPPTFARQGRAVVSSFQCSRPSVAIKHPDKLGRWLRMPEPTLVY